MKFAKKTIITFLSVVFVFNTNIYAKSPSPSNSAKPTQTAKPIQSAKPLTEIDKKKIEKTNEMLMQINELRKKNNLTAVKIDKNLNKLAEIRVAELTKTGNFTHDLEVSGSFTDFLDNNNVKWEACAENFSKGSLDAKKVFENWTASKIHKENILTKDATSIGISCNMSEKNPYWTIIFIKYEK